VADKDSGSTLVFTVSSQPP